MIVFRTVVLQKLFDIKFSYKHCNFSRVCLLVKMASKTVTRSIIPWIHVSLKWYVPMENEQKNYIRK